MLGDVGGLFGSLTLLGSKYVWFVSIFTGNRMKRYVNEQVFKMEPKKTREQTGHSSLDVIKSIKKRKTPNFCLSGRMLKLCRHRKEYKL